MKSDDVAFHTVELHKRFDAIGSGVDADAVSRIFVMTPEILLNYLCHGVVPYSRIGLLILDEVHHVSWKDKNKHCFSQVLRYFHKPEDVRKSAKM